jgi:hypothetical protein
MRPEQNGPAPERERLLKVLKPFNLNVVGRVFGRNDDGLNQGLSQQRHQRAQNAAALCMGEPVTERSLEIFMSQPHAASDNTAGGNAQEAAALDGKHGRQQAYAKHEQAHGAVFQQMSEFFSGNHGISRRDKLRLSS